MKSGLLSLCYWAPLDYYAQVISLDSIILEQWESFPKQSFRNRCYIDSPNGVLMLNFPIDHGSKSTFKDCRLSQSINWQQKHWQALKSSYGSSPFFDAIAPELEQLYTQKWEFVLDLNLKCLEMSLNWLRLSPEIKLSQSWSAESAPEILDFRKDFHPKTPPMLEFNPYPQVFDHKHGFQPRLSILDLIFNEGPASYDYLHSL